MNDLLQYIQSQNSSGTGVTIANIEPLLKVMPDKITVAELNELVKFASNQVGIWEAEWMFSPSISPQLTAKTEADQWGRLWESWLESLSKLIPDVKEQSERAHRLTVLKHHLSKSVDYNKGKNLTKIISVSLSKIAIVLNKFGIHGLAEHLYMLALYPKGTVGRTI